MIPKISSCSIVFVTIVITILSPYVHAGIENRPLNSDEATVLDKNQFGLATGITFFRYPNDEGEWDWVIDIEYGIFERTEIDIEIPYRNINYSDSKLEDVDGLGDIAIWLERSVIDEKNILPAISLAFSVKTQSGDEDKDLGTGENNYQLTVLVSKTFGNTSFHVNLGYTFVGEPPDTDLRDTWNYNFAVEHKLNSKIMLVGEIYGQTNQEPTSNTDPLDILFGCIYSFTDNLSLDFGIGTGLTNASPDIRVTGGATYSF